MLKGGVEFCAVLRGQTRELECTKSVGRFSLLGRFDCESLGGVRVFGDISGGRFLECGRVRGLLPVLKKTPRRFLQYFCINPKLPAELRVNTLLQCDRIRVRVGLPEASLRFGVCKNCVSKFLNLDDVLIYFAG